MPSLKSECSLLINEREIDIGRQLEISLTFFNDLRCGVSHVGFLKCGVSVTHRQCCKKDAYNYVT